MKQILINAIAAAVLCLTLGCSHTHNISEMHYARPPETMNPDDPKDTELLLSVLLRANVEHWISDAIRRGKSVNEAFEEADAIYNAISPNPNDRITDYYSDWDTWEAYRLSWNEHMAELEADRKARRTEYKAESEARIAKIKADFDKRLEEYRESCCREEHSHESTD